MRKADTTFETTLIAYERLKNSANGNPRFRLHTEHGFFPTLSDGAVSYEIQNIKIPADDGVRARLVTTPGGKVREIEVL